MWLSSSKQNSRNRSRNNHIIRESNLLQYFRVVRYWAADAYGLTKGEVELLIFLEPLGYFTAKEFSYGQNNLAWNRDRLKMLKNDGWLDRVKKDYHDKQKFRVSLKGRRMVNRIYKILMREEDIPESKRRNNIMKRRSYSDKIYSNLIVEFNKT